MIHLRRLHIALTVAVWLSWAYFVATLPSPDPDWRVHAWTWFFVAAFGLTGMLKLWNPKER